MNLSKKSSSVFVSVFFQQCGVISDFVSQYSESVIVEQMQSVVTIFYKTKKGSVPIFTNEILRCTNSNLALVGGMIGGLGGGPAGAAAGG